ncbi:outer membrane beta-barrel protein [Pedobacter montanisoli]|uniref:PorT family protein n=1 Tax=Pedobacter montanisoli TaxID=2923277 RepID=A0ABS9ZUY1_9SPHI|nr:outer membrane beta-barrel protein [Pedobacter montanisoli]MCJ0742183.1 PorT family protein [Pedobacter montanisoli]
MKELDDKDFDRIFRSRINDQFPDFEEESWLKMERKLRKRDRGIFFRYASVILLFISFGIAVYYRNSKSPEMSDIAKNKIQSSKHNNYTNLNSIGQSPVLPPKSDSDHTNRLYTSKKSNQLENNIINYSIPTQTKPSANTAIGEDYTIQNIIVNNNQIIPNVTQSSTSLVLDTTQHSASIVTAPQEKTSQNEETPIKNQLKLPLTLAFTAGPDFSSTSTMIGGKSGVFAGLSIGVQLTKKLAVQTGLVYGSKNYDARSFDYTFNNPNTQNIISNIKAACKVLEIPLRASYSVTDNAKRNITINAGLSSYIMLNEKYIFKYTPESNRADRISSVNNANQHLLNVLDISATYNIKLENKRFSVGIEPYFKIPLTGIGQGSVPLKSNGISLKLNYDFSKN